MANADIAYDEYKKVSDQVYFRNVCPTLEKLKIVSLDTCSNDTDSKITEGLKLTLVQIADMLNSLGRVWKTWKVDPTTKTKFNTSNSLYEIYPDKINNQLINIITFKGAREISKTILFYLNKGYAIG